MEELKPWEVAAQKTQEDPELKPWEQAANKKKITGEGVESTSKPSEIGGITDQRSLLSGQKTTAPLILTPEKQQEYRKAQKYVKPATKPKSIKEAVDDDNSYLGALWNQVVGSVSDAAAGTMGLSTKDIGNSNTLNALSFLEKVQHKLYGSVTKALTGEDYTNGAATPMSDLKEQTKSLSISQGNQAQEATKALVNKARTGSSSKQYEEELQSGFDVTDGLGATDAKALPLMMTRLGADIGLSIPTAGISFVAQGYQQGIDDYDKSIKESGVEPDDNTRELFGVAYGTINGLMDKLGLDLITKNNPVSKAVKNAILKAGVKALSNVEGKITGEVIEKTMAELATKTFNKVKTVGVKTAIAGLGEGGTEAVQGGLSDGLKVLTNKLSDKEVFNSDDLKADFWANRLNDLAGGAILGGVAGGAIHGLRSSASHIAERVAESTTPEQIEEFKAEIEAEVNSGNLDSDRATELIGAIDKYSKINETLPQGLNAEKRAKIFQQISERDALLEQKTQLESQLKELDPAFTPDVENQTAIVENKVQQKNDAIREEATGERYRFFKDPEKDIYYKQLGEGQPEEIDKEYYDLQKQDAIQEVRENEKAEKEDAKESEQLATEMATETIELPDIKPEPEVPVVEEVPIEADIDYSDVNPETGNITKESLSESREQLGLPEIEVDPTRSDEQVKADADAFIQEGGDVFKMVDDLISGKKKAVSDTEINTLAATLAEKNTQFEKAKGKLLNAIRDGNQRAIDAAIVEKDALLKEVNDIQTAGRFAGRAAGRSLRQLQVSRVQDNSLSGFLETALRNNGNQALTTEQVQQTEEAHSKFEQLWNESQSKISDLEAKMAQLEQDYALLRLKKENDAEKRKQRRSISNEDRIKRIREDRKTILADISRISREQRSKLSANPISVEYFKPIAKLAKNYVEEGIVKLDDLVSKIHEDLKDHIDGVTERDIRDVISGYGREAAMTRDGLRNQIEELKTQARLISAIEDAEAKVGRYTGSKKKEASERVKELRAALKTLIDADKVVPTQEEIQLKSYKSRIKNRIDELNQRIANKDFVTPNKEALQMDEEAKRLRDEALRVKRDFNIESEKWKLANRTQGQKFYDDLSNYVGLTKSLKATWDLSAPFRQGIVASVNHPIHAWEAFWKMHKAAKSEEFYDRFRNDLEASPIYKLMEDSGLSLTTNKSAHVLAKEEDYSTTISEKVPFVKGSERAYSFYLNYLRANLFIDAATELQRDGYTFDTHPEEFKSIARVINNETGRGGLGSLEKHSSLAGNVLWSPRLMASRINLFTSIFDKSYTPRARKQAAADLARFIGTVAAMMFAASMNDDWEVDYNPLSSNFGKVKRGDTRYSLMGGMESYIVFMARMLTGMTKDGKGKIKDLGGDKFGSRSRGDIAETFFRGKANPIAGIVANLAYGKDVVGNKYEAWDVADEAIPLVLPEIMDAYKAGGLGEVVKTIPFTTYGVGVSRYSNNKNKDPKGFVETVYKYSTGN